MTAHGSGFAGGRSIAPQMRWSWEPFLGQAQSGLHSRGQCAEVGVQGRSEQSYSGDDDHGDEAHQN